ncbi:MAG: hypothetical protein WB869_20820 [Candidatus Acidiferrales bacterium]
MIYSSTDLAGMTGCGPLDWGRRGGWQPGIRVAGKFPNELRVMDVINEIFAGALAVEMIQTIGNAM